MHGATSPAMCPESNLDFGHQQPFAMKAPDLWTGGFLHAQVAMLIMPMQNTRPAQCR